MNLDTALGILRALAAGANPRTGEVFPPDSPYQHPDIVRALWLILLILEKSPSTRSNTLPARAGKPWSRMENVALRHSFQRGASIAELGKRHLRTEGGIRSRLEKLGLIEVEPSVSKPHPSQEAAFLRAEKSYLDQGDYLDQEQLAAHRGDIDDIEYDETEVVQKDQHKEDMYEPYHEEPESDRNKEDWSDIRDDLDPVDWAVILRGPDDNDIDRYYEQLGNSCEG